MSYVDIKELIATADSSSIDHGKGSYAGGPQIHRRVPKIMMKMGIRGPHFHEILGTGTGTVDTAFKKLQELHTS